MALTTTQHQLGFAFGILGNIISTLVFLAPVPTFYRIYKKKSTESFQSLPYQVALFSCMLWLYYALLKGNDTFLLITINSFGCIVETVYITLYISYAPKKIRISSMKLFFSLNVALFSSILLVTHFLIKDEQRVAFLGWVNVAISVCVFAAPLNIVRQVIKTKSVEFMPFTLSFFLTLSAIMWFGFGLFHEDMCVALPNVIGFILGMLQMILYAIYKNAQNVQTDDKNEKRLPELKSIVIIDSEIYLVDESKNKDFENAKNINEKIKQEKKDENKKEEEATGKNGEGEEKNETLSIERFV